MLITIETVSRCVVREAITYFCNYIHLFIINLYQSYLFLILNIILFILLLC